MRPELIVAITVCFIVWIIFGTLRRYLTTRSNAAIQEKVFARIDSAQSMLELAANESGRRFLESLTLERVNPPNPADVSSTASKWAPSSPASGSLCCSSTTPSAICQKGSVCSSSAPARSGWASASSSPLRSASPSPARCLRSPRTSAMTLAADMSPSALARVLHPSPADRTGTPHSALMTEPEFKRLYDATSTPVLGYLLATTGRRDVAEDLLQETFCRFLSQPRGMDLLESRRYLFRIATNLLRDRWRKHEDAPFTEPREAGYAPDLDATLHVRSALQQLKPRERELLWLAYVEGMDHREIAAVTGLQRLSIRMLLSRARRRAAALLTSEVRV